MQRNLITLLQLPPPHPLTPLPLLWNRSESSEQTTSSIKGISRETRSLHQGGADVGSGYTLSHKPSDLVWFPLVLGSTSPAFQRDLKPPFHHVVTCEAFPSYPNSNLSLSSLLFSVLLYKHLLPTTDSIPDGAPLLATHRQINQSNNTPINSNYALISSGRALLETGKDGAVVEGSVCVLEHY